MSKEYSHTFVICAYKESHYLEECIKSIQSQTAPSKVIISTGTPNKYISDVAKKYNIELYTHLHPGIGVDWNNGLALAKTPFVTLAHQDDIYLPEYVDATLTQMNQSNTLIAFTDYRELQDKDVRVKNANLKIKRRMLYPIKIFKKSIFIRRLILSLGNPICCPAVTYNMKKLKDFRFIENMRSNLDWDAWERISKMTGEFTFIDKELMYHRIHEDSETSNAIASNKRTTEDLAMFERFWPKPIARLLIKQYIKSQETN
ncbi:glycosyl transferase [Enterococcus florum]|uniref:Glycosyl transferase n=1 Tax=Enterococcus florum TaxID=2480627 RepID=A0A4P5PE85_9ENTE|nr:glycosyltransferase [Enterococcus florum]GCF93922.1 glycosyl transferase [Enterococcus florum]